MLSNEGTKAWHTFGMEWKEHIAWTAPILVTAVVYLVRKYGPQLASEDRVRKAALTMFVLAAGAASVAALLGALLNKLAPVR